MNLTNWTNRNEFVLIRLISSIRVPLVYIYAKISVTYLLRTMQYRGD